MSLPVLAITLTAGLWPFQHPLNDAHWSSTGQGLVFGSHGVALEERAARTEGATDGSVTLEIAVQPQSTDESAAFLSFFDPSTGGYVVLRQDLNDLEICRNDCGAWSRERMLAVNVFTAKQVTFLTAVSSGSGTTIYSGGRAIKRVAGFHLHPGTSQIVLGTSPVTHDGWEGRYLRLRMYDRALGSAEVLSGYEAWRQGRETPSSGLLVKYDFDARAGSSVADSSGSGRDLVIPPRYKLVAPRRLESPASAYRANWSYSADVAINILGFSPMGLVLYGYLLSSPNRRSYAAAALAILLSAGVSLAIEIAQTWLPTRNSDLTDVLNNTLGAMAGVAVLQFVFVMFPQWRAER